MSMETLENRIYTRKEISEIMKIPLDSNFKRNITRRLDFLGYNYTYTRTTVEVISRNDEGIIREIAKESYGLTISGYEKHFAMFLHLLTTYDSYSAMPWDERAKELNRKTSLIINGKSIVKGLFIDGKTLANWFHHLGEIQFDKDKRELWMTQWDGKNRYRTHINTDSPDVADQEFIHKSKQFFAYLKAEGYSKKAFSQACKIFNCCFYYVNRLALASFYKEPFSTLLDACNRVIKRERDDMRDELARYADPLGFYE